MGFGADWRRGCGNDIKAEPGGGGFEDGQKGAVDEEEEEMDVRESKAEEEGEEGERELFSLSMSVHGVRSRGDCSE